MGRSTIGLCLLAIFASANAFFPLIPEGKELIYHYHGLIRSGTHMPKSFSSAFILDGDMHLQTDKNSSFVYFSNLKFKLYNGEYDEWHEFNTKQIDLPKELEFFERPFKVVYEPCGHAWGIAVEADEPQYTINAKRGIASILQMYTEKLDWTTLKPYAFKTKEYTLYGKGPYYYTVFPGTDEWTIKKMAEPHSYSHLYSQLYTSVKMATCDRKYDEPLSRDSVQEYHIVKKNGAHVMDYMESNAGIYYTPYAGEGYNFHIYMNQTMTLEKTIEAATPITLKSEKFYHGLNFYAADFNSMEALSDLFHGRRTSDQDKMLIDLEEMLYDTVKYIHEYHLDMKKPDWTRSQLVNRMMFLMVHLDQSHFDAMTSKLMQKTTEEDKEALHVYYHMLPMVGNHASIMYMMKLMKTKKIKDKLALEWLQNMPFHVKEPNKKLIERLSEMLEWEEDISENVRKSAILAFGTFLEKAVFRHNKVNHINNWSGHEGHDIKENFTPDFELDAVFPSAKYYEKYITLMGEKLWAAKTDGMRNIFISALFNSRIEKAVHYLLPIAKGKLFDNHWLRILAIRSIGGIIYHNDEMVYEIFWPIMADFNLYTSVRITAYQQIMKSHPSIHRLANLLWQMHKEENYVLYQFHYSYMENIAHSTDPCMADFRTAIKQILAYSAKPQYYGVTGYYETDYFDTKYEFGNQWSLAIVKVPGERDIMAKVEMGHTVDNARFPLFGFLYHIEGLDASILEDVMLYTKDPTKMFNFEKIQKAFHNIYNNKDIKIDIAITTYDHVIMNYHYDASNIKEFANVLDFFVGDKYNYIKKYFTITYPMQAAAIMPTEIGFPAIFNMHIPKIYMFDIKITKDIVNNMITWHYDTHIKEWVNGRIGLSFYNPFIDMYQGVAKVIHFENEQPLYFDLSFNPAQQSMKLSWKRHEDPLKDAYGMKFHGATFTFFRDDFKTGLLQKSHADAKNWELVSYGDEHRDTRVLYENDCSNTGYHHIVAKVDSDAWMSNLTIFKQFNYLHTSQNYHTGAGHWFLTRFHALMHAFEQPYPQTNGILRRSEVSKQFPVTSVDINVRFTREYKRGDLLFNPASKWNLRATYAIKNKEATVKTWDANLILDSNLGHTTTTTKGIFSRLIPGQKEWRVCVDGKFSQTDVDVAGEYTIAMTHSAEPKCTKDEKVMEIKVLGEKLPEQLSGKHLYGECQGEYLWSDIHERNSFDCYYARDTLRKWTNDYKTFNVPTEFKRYINDFFDWTKVSYMKYLTKYTEASMDLDKDSWRVVHEYPLIGEKVDSHIYTSEHDFKFSGIPVIKYPIYYYHMLHTLNIPPMFKFMSKMGWTQICEVHQDYYYNATLDSNEYQMPQEWTMYLGNAETDAHHGIWMKNLKDEYAAMKMMHGEHVLEITPTGHKTYEIKVDGEVQSNIWQLKKDWFWMDLVKETGVFSIFCKHTGSHIVFDGHHLFHEHPNVDVPMYGKCA